MKNKLILMWAAIIGVYALIPSLIAAFFGGGTGEGSYAIFMIPIFWPTLSTFYFSTVLIYLFSALIGFPSSKSLLFEISRNILNIILWIIIGSFIGFIIQRLKRKWA